MENEYISNKILDEIKSSFLENKNEESCGLITEKNQEYKFIKCNNTAKDKKNNFSISPIDYIKAKSFGNIIYCCHSHLKNGSFSNQDITNSFSNKISYLLYNIKEDKFYFFDIKTYEKCQKYLNLDFELGKNDCSNIIYNFYKNELNIEAPIKPIFDTQSYTELKNNNLHIWDKKIYNKNYQLFDSIDFKSFENLNKYDILVFNDKNKIPTHGAIYLNQNLILHQMYESASRIESLRKGHTKYISGVFRYKNYDSFSK
jgi:hypothetical protein